MHAWHTYTFCILSILPPKQERRKTRQRPIFPLPFYAPPLSRVAVDSSAWAILVVYTLIIMIRSSSASFTRPPIHAWSASSVFCRLSKPGTLMKYRLRRYLRLNVSENAVQGGAGGVGD